MPLLRVASGQQPQCNTRVLTRAGQLLDLLVRMVLAAEGAEFLHLQPFRGGLFVLHAGVVFTLALGALKRDVFARHDCLPSDLKFDNSADKVGYSIISLTVPAPTVRPPSRIAKRRPLSMAMGVISSISSCTLSPGITISMPAGNCATPVTSVVRK